MLGAAYMLWLYKKVFFGIIKSDEVQALKDMNKRELAIFAPLIILIFWIGFYPGPFLEIMHASVEQLLAQSHTIKAGTAAVAMY